MNYFIAVNGQQTGPFTLEDLAAQRVTAQTLVWREGMAAWAPAGTLPELASILVSSEATQYQQPQQPYQQPQQPYQQPQQPYQQPQQPYQQPQQAFQQPPYTNPARSQMPMPETHMVFAVLVTLFCCLPFGIAGIVNASAVSSAYAMGNYQEAVRKSESAKKWSMWGLIGGAIVIILYFIFLGIAAASNM